MQRVALGIEYHGAKYSGWQKQKGQSSIQEHIEKAVGRVANHEVAVVCAGRTDAGVHACGQVIHFDTTSERSHLAWIRGVNTYLPADIRILWAKPVDFAFNARRSALFRRYCYLLSDTPIRPGILHKNVAWVMGRLDHHLMQVGASYLIGKHDFTSFRANQCQSKSPFRTVYSINLQRKNGSIFIEITANAFLHHMVRNIVGTLIQVGHKKYSPEWVQQVLEAKDRRLAGYTAPSDGLYLLNVGYPDCFCIPTQVYLPWFS